MPNRKPTGNHEHKTRTMKKIILTSLIMLGLSFAKAQVPSDCTVPAVLKKNYEWEVANMALKWLYTLHSPDTVFIDIPQWCQDTVWKGLAAIYNRNYLVEVDSIFNKFCIHGAGWDIVIWRNLSVFVDTTYAWTTNWANLQTITGIPALDSLLEKYGFTVTGFYHEYDNQHRAKLQTDQMINEYNLCDSLESFPGIIHAYQAALGGQGAMSGITFNDTGYVKYLTFHLGWGMANGHTWRYKVYPDCSTDFLGVTKNFYEPYPDLVNCNITGIPHPAAPFHDVEIYPNPSTGVFTVSLPENTSGYSITILNLNGQKIISYQITGMDTQLDLSNLAKGIYLVSVISEKTMQIGKFVKE